MVYLPCTIPNSRRIHSDDFYVNIMTVMEKMDARMTSFRVINLHNL